MLQTSCRYVINSKLCNILVFGRVTGLLRLAFICAPRLCILIYPIGVPVLMYAIMRYQNVPGLARKKIRSGLITAMIIHYLKGTTTPSSLKT